MKQFNIYRSANHASAMVAAHGLRPIDVVVLKRNAFRMVDHYMVYLGTDRNGKHWFVANMEDGVTELSEQDLSSRAHEFEVSRIRRFEGGATERQAAFTRAEEMVGTRYSLVGYNCEHFANYVQYGRATSQQVAIGGGLTALAGAAMLTSKHDGVKALGVIGVAAGLFNLIRNL